MCEGRTIQHRLQHYRNAAGNHYQLSCNFANYMMEGKVGSAILLLSSKSKGHVLSLDTVVGTNGSSSTTVRDVLLQKHPAPGFVSTPPIDHHPHLISLMVM